MHFFVLPIFDGAIMDGHILSGGCRLLPSNVSQCQATDSHKHSLNWLVHMF